MSIQIYCSNNTTRLLAPRLSPVEGDMGSSPFPHPTLPTLATAGAARRKPEQRGGRRRAISSSPSSSSPNLFPSSLLVAALWAQPAARSTPEMAGSTRMAARSALSWRFSPFPLVGFLCCKKGCRCPWRGSGGHRRQGARWPARSLWRCFSGIVVT